MAKIKIYSSLTKEEFLRLTALKLAVKTKIAFKLADKNATNIAESYVEYMTGKDRKR